MANEHDDKDRAYRKAVQVSLAAIIAVTFLGFALGTRTMPRAELERRVDETSEAETVPMSVAYRQVPDRRRARLDGPVSLAPLREGIPTILDPVTLTTGQYESAIEFRATRRAYAGAPPTIPHVTMQLSADNCLACHGEGIRFDGKIAPVMSHEHHTQCTQCHVTNLSGAVLQVPNTFNGLQTHGHGSRAWKGAPPTIPHPIWMRDECASCHGVNGQPGLRTTHPGRTNCLQCHAKTQRVLPWLK